MAGGGFGAAEAPRLCRTEVSQQFHPGETMSRHSSTAGRDGLQVLDGLGAFISNPPALTSMRCIPSTLSPPLRTLDTCTSHTCAVLISNIAVIKIHKLVKMFLPLLTFSWPTSAAGPIMRNPIVYRVKTRSVLDHQEAARSQM